MGERDLDIDVKDLSVERSKIATRFHLDKYETNQWGPQNTRDPTWKKNEKIFEKVKFIHQLMCYFSYNFSSKTSYLNDFGLYLGTGSGKGFVDAWLSHLQECQPNGSHGG